MKVLIGLSTMEHIRKADFMPYFLGLEKPPNSLITTVHGQSPAKSRNVIIDQAIENECTHIFFMDDDMAIPPDSLIKLLAHDKDVVSGLYLMRSYPHFPVAFDIAFDNGYNKYIYMKPEVSGLIEVTNCGLGCALIKTEVFKALEKPYVRLGEIEKDGWCDDVGFFNRVRAAGFKIYLDTDVKCGHMTSVTIWPTFANNQWWSEYKSASGNVLIPQHIPTEAETKNELAPLQVLNL
jgi:GT2 family glycosyltransferase